MKKLMLLILAGALVSLPACKKGENDPFLSLSSRKARLAGVYNVDSWSSAYSSVDSNGDVEGLTTTITGATGTSVSTETPSGEGTTTFTRNISVQKSEFTFDKDGSWSLTFNTTTTWEEEGGGWLIDSYAYTQVATSIQSGTWAFLTGEGDEFKNKERVLLSAIDMTETEQTTEVTLYIDGSTSTNEGELNTSIVLYPNGASSAIYEIDMLKGKEMTFVQDLSNIGTYKTTSGAITFIFTVTGTGDVEIKLSEK